MRFDRKWLWSLKGRISRHETQFSVERQNFKSSERAGRQARLLPVGCAEDKPVAQLVPVSRGPISSANRQFSLEGSLVGFLFIQRPHSAMVTNSPQSEITIIHTKGDTNAPTNGLDH